MTAPATWPEGPGQALLSQHVFDALDEPVLIVDTTERIVGINRAARHELEVDVSGATGLSLADLDCEPWRSCRMLARLVRMRGEKRQRDLRETHSGRHWQIRCRFLDGSSKPGGPSTSLLQDVEPAALTAEAAPADAAPGPGPGGRLLLLVLRETTEFHLLRDAMQQYERSSWVAEVVGGIAHQVSNPLFAISSSFDWLKQQLTGKNVEEGVVANLEREISRLSALMRAFVEFATVSCRERVRCDLESLVRDACTATGLDPTGFRVNCRMEPGVEALVDRDAMMLALGKVLENARDLSPPLETIRISGQLVSADSVRSGPGAMLEIRIVDNGPGIAPAHRRKIFEPFFSSRPGHSGLGLSLASRVLIGHGGTISCEEKRQGASILLRLPTTAIYGDGSDD